MAKLSPEHNLAVKHPDVAKEWHPSKNGPLTPFQVTPGSGKKVWWQCSKNKGHDWEATIKNRANGTGCRKCYNKIRHHNFRRRKKP